VEGNTTTVELRNQDTVQGMIENVDEMQNMIITDATFTPHLGRPITFESFYVLGK
jgi:small nuclear ribonucleoprotein (snRNP)-like protein